MHYVGETKRDWLDRLSNHFRNITKELMVFPVGHHFSKMIGHNSLQDMKLYVLEFCQIPPEDSYRQHREQAEKMWQYRLHSNYPIGMNRNDYLPGGNTVKPQTR